MEDKTKEYLEKRIQEATEFIVQLSDVKNDREEDLEKAGMAVGELEETIEDLGTEIYDKREILNKLRKELKELSPSKHKDKSYVLIIPYGTDITINYGKAWQSKMWHVLVNSQRKKSTLSKMGVTCKLVENKELKEKQKNL